MLLKALNTHPQSSNIRRPLALLALTATATLGLAQSPTDIPLPITNIIVNAGQVHLAWADTHGKNLEDLKIYEATSLTGAWLEVTNPSKSLGGITVLADTNAKFFRLFADAASAVLPGIALDDPDLTATFAVVAFADAGGAVMDWEGLVPPPGTVYALIMAKDAILGHCTLQAKDYGGVGEDSLGYSYNGHIWVYPGYDTAGGGSQANVDRYGSSMLAPQKLVDDWFDGTAGQVQEWCPQTIRDAAVKVSFPVGDANGYFQSPGTGWELDVAETGVSKPDPETGALKAFLLSASEFDQWTRGASFKLPNGPCMLRSGYGANQQFITGASGGLFTNFRYTEYQLRPALWIEIRQ